MIILITGKPNTGKSTALKKIASMLGYRRCAGLLAEEILVNDQRMGFLTRGIKSEIEIILAHKDLPKEKAVEDFGVDLKALEDISRQEVKQALNDVKVKFILIDEIGRMQVMSQIFCQLLEKIMESGKTLIATVCYQDDVDYICRLKKRADELIVLDETNRNEVPQEVIRKVNKDDSLYLSKIDLAYKYISEPERYTYEADRIILKSTHDTRIITKEKGIYHCTCDYYKENGVCSHILSLLLRQ